MKDHSCAETIVSYLRGWRDTFRSSAFWRGFRDGFTWGPIRRTVTRFCRYYRTCRNKDGTYHHIGSTSRWRALKFAIDMTWWSIRHG